MADETTATPIESGTVPNRNATNLSQVADRIAVKLGTAGPPESVDTDSAVATSEVTPPVHVEDAQEATPAPVEADAELAEAKDPSGDETAAEPDSDDDEQSVTPTLANLAELLDTTVDVLRDQLEVTAKIDGRDETVTIKEAIDGYQRQADYTRRTMELGEQTRQFESAVTQANAHLESKFTEADNLLGYLSGQLTMGWTDESLSQLRDSNPSQYMEVKELLDQNRAGFEAAKERRIDEFKRGQEKQGADFAKWRGDQQRQLLAQLPELADVAKQAKFESEIGTYLSGHKFNEPEVAQFMKTFDHRHVLIIRDAMRYRAAQKGADETTLTLKKLPKKAKAAAKTDAKATELNSKRGTLRKSGSVKDFAALMKQRGVA